jgi:hypothetical protein
LQPRCGEQFPPSAIRTIVLNHPYLFKLNNCKCFEKETSVKHSIYSEQKIFSCKNNIEQKAEEIENIE